MGARVVIGVAASGSATGLVVRVGERLVDAEIIWRTTPERDQARLALDAYVRQVLGRVAAHHDSQLQAGMPEPLVACVGPLLTSQTWINYGAIGLIAGALLAMPWQVRLVSYHAARRGVSSLGDYPARLVGLRETGSGRLRHCRMAWNAAGLAMQPREVA
jgi:hypothetical protein